MIEAKKYLIQILKDNDTCVLALSGGPDSMCLLHLLKNMDKKINIICAHVNHQTRDGNELEYEFIKKYLAKENITLEYYKIEGYQKDRFSEQEGREKRYRFLKDTVMKYQADYLLTAHHGDDLVETIIMRILRGSTLEGYSGIKKESIWDNVRILRPLLTATKKEIMRYLKEEDIPYVIDETNESDDYLRNRLRHHVLPLLEQEIENYNLKFLKFSETLNKANHMINNEIRKTLQNLKKENKIQKEAFLKKEVETQEFVLREYIKSIYQKDLSSISDKHITIILDFIRKTNHSSSLNLPKNRILYNNKYYFWIENKTQVESYCIKCEKQTILPRGDIVEKRDTYEEKSNYEIHLDSKSIKLPVYLTTRKNGMKMAVKNLNGHKKINDILNDVKVPKEKKDEIPIMVDNNGTVLWILGVSKSKYDLEKNENYDIIYKYIKRKEI